jgi:TPP-dependent pyruvate/acetoin dehydrogenase alpha subunit
MTSNREPDAETKIEIFRRMALLKLNDEKSRQVIRSGRLMMPYYSYRGQEAIPSGVSVNLTGDDYICTIYRGIHDILAKGMDLKQLWAEIAGRATGSCKGKGGPMHLTYPEKGVMVTTGVVGGSMPVANGIAWGSQLSGNDRVTVAYFGDGASNIGAFHEALNLAAVWKLPVVFVCQNNRYGEHTAYAKTTSAPRIADRAAGYGIPGLRIDGNDPLEVWVTAREAIARARAGEGPTLIEAMTFRFHGHVFGDTDAYMDPAEKQAAIEADPYPRYRTLLIESGVASESDLATIESEIEGKIEKAVTFALESPFPVEDELRRDVYAEEIRA